MSYGRKPQYIYECACGGASDDFHGPTERGARHVVFLCRAIEWSELAQFIAVADRRRELEGLVTLGINLMNEADGSPVRLMERIDVVDPDRCTTDQLLGIAANELQYKFPILAESLRTRMMRLRGLAGDDPAIRPEKA
jgi:hypothetical protein